MKLRLAVSKVKGVLTGRREPEPEIDMTPARCEYPGCNNGKVRGPSGGLLDCPLCEGRGVDETRDAADVAAVIQDLPEPERTLEVEPTPTDEVLLTDSDTGEADNIKRAQLRTAAIKVRSALREKHPQLAEQISLDEMAAMLDDVVKEPKRGREGLAGFKGERFLAINEKGQVEGSADTRDIVDQNLSQASIKTYVYKRIATAQPRTGADIHEDEE